MQANETAWIDATSPANKALAGFEEVKTLDLFFETKDANDHTSDVPRRLRRCGAKD